MERFHYGLLLEDVVGYAKDRSELFYTEASISKGSLLQALLPCSTSVAGPTYPHHNYTLLADFSVTLYCDSNLVHQLTTVQMDLLCGILSFADRLKQIEKLSWAESLKIGFSVSVSLQSTSSPQKATIQYIGEVHGKCGRRFGLKLKV